MYGWAWRLLESRAPWKPGFGQLPVAVRFAVVLGLVIYVVAAPRRAIMKLTRVVAFYLLVAGLQYLFKSALRPGALIGRATTLMHRLIMVIGAAIVLLSPWLGPASDGSGRVVISVAIVASGFVGIYGALTDERLPQTRFSSALNGAIEVAIGALLFATDPGRSVIVILVLMMILAGIVIASRLRWRYRQLTGRSV